jgi:hypothetical protein
VSVAQKCAKWVIAERETNEHTLADFGFVFAATVWLMVNALPILIARERVRAGVDGRSPSPGRRGAAAAR